MFLDTSGLLCCLDRRERDHLSAIEFMQIANWRLTHNLVFTELVALAAKRGLNRKHVLQFVSDLQESPAIDVVFVNEEIHELALRSSSVMAININRFDAHFSAVNPSRFAVAMRAGASDESADSRGRFSAMNPRRASG